MNNKRRIPIFYAILSASLYAIGFPLSKLLLDKIPSTMMAAFLYLGAGAGMMMVGVIRKGIVKNHNEVKFIKNDFPYIVGMILLDIVAPIFLMVGLNYTTSANVSLLNNFEIVATSVVALFVFGEVISRKLWFGIVLITISSMILSFEDLSSLSFSTGSIFVLGACVCWGFENNCTRMLSQKDPLKIVVIKGFGSGVGSLIIAMVLKEHFIDIKYILFAILLGFVAYGLSIFFYVFAQRELGAAKTSVYYAVGPFIGATISLIIFHQSPSITFILALIIMIIGTYFASVDNMIS